MDLTALSPQVDVAARRGDGYLCIKTWARATVCRLACNLEFKYSPGPVESSDLVWLPRSIPFPKQIWPKVAG